MLLPFLCTLTVRYALLCKLWGGCSDALLWMGNWQEFKEGCGVRTGFAHVSYTFFIVLQFVEIGIVTSIEINHKPVEVAKKGQEVCVKIEPIPGESPKMYGRHFEATDILVSKVKAICIFGS